MVTVLREDISRGGDGRGRYETEELEMRSSRGAETVISLSLTTTSSRPEEAESCLSWWWWW